MSGGGQNTVTNNSAPPAQVLAAYQNAQATAQNAAAAPLQQYQGQIVAPLTPDQTTAMQTIDQSQGIAQPYINTASQLASGAATPITPTPFSAGAVQQYMSPYTADVVNATSANIDETNLEQQQALKGNAIAQGAWGGDRAGVASAEMARQQNLAKGQTIAGLENAGYTQGLGEFNQEQTTGVNAQTASDWLKANAASTYGALGNEAQSSALNGAAAQLQSGTLQQSQNQANLNVPYQQFLQQQAYPFQTSQFLTSTAEGLGNQGGGSTSSSPGPDQTGQYVGAAATLGLAAAMIFSKRGGRIEPKRKGFAAGGMPGLPGGLSGGLPGGLAGMPGLPGSVQSLPSVPDVNVNIVGAGPSGGGGGGSFGAIPVAHAPSGDNGSSAQTAGNEILGAAKAYTGIKQPPPTNILTTDNYGADAVPPNALNGKPPVPNASAVPDAGAIPSASGFSDPAMFGDMYGGADAVAAMPVEARGGRIGFDDGGTVAAGLMDAGVGDTMGGSPVANNMLQNYAGMPVEKLQEMAARVPAGSPQAQYIQRALMAAHMKPQAAPAGTGFAAGAPQAAQGPTGFAAAPMAPPPQQGQQPQLASPMGYRQGGFARGYADGGAPDDDSAAIANAYGAAPTTGWGQVLRAMQATSGDTPVDPEGLQGYAAPTEPKAPPSDRGAAWTPPSWMPIGAPTEPAGYAPDVSGLFKGGAHAAEASGPDMGDVYATARSGQPVPPDLSGVGDLYAPPRGLAGAPPSGDSGAGAAMAGDSGMGDLYAPPRGSDDDNGPLPSRDGGDSFDYPLSPPAAPHGAGSGHRPSMGAPAAAAAPPPPDQGPQPDLSGKVPSALNPTGGPTAATPPAGLSAPPPDTASGPAKRAWNDPHNLMPFLAAAAGMAASRSHTFAGQFGEGALKGIEFYTGQEKQDREQQIADQTGKYQTGELANSSKRVDLEAQGLAARAEEARLQHAEAARHNQADEGLRHEQIAQTGSYQSGELGLRAQQIQAEQAFHSGELSNTEKRNQMERDYHDDEVAYRNKMADRGKFELVSGTGKDDDGNVVPGVYHHNIITDETQFRPGETMTGKPGAGGAKSGATNDLVKQLIADGSAKDTQGALAIIHDPSGVRGQQLHNSVEKLALSAASADTGGISDPKANLDKWRDYYKLGATAAPGEAPAKAPAQQQAPAIPSRPDGVPPNAQFSPGQRNWWWQGTDGKWQNSGGG